MRKSRSFCVNSIAIALLAMMALPQSGVAQQMRKSGEPPYQLKIPVTSKFQIPFVVAGGMMLIASPVLTTMASRNPNRYSDLFYVGLTMAGGWWIPPMTGELLEKVDYKRLTVRIFVTHFKEKKDVSSIASNLVEVGAVETIWKSMLRQCRLYGGGADQSTMAELESLARAYDVLANIQNDNVRAKQLCGYLFKVDEQAKLMQAQKRGYSPRAAAEDIVGRKLTPGDAIRFENLFILAGVY